MIPVLVLIVIFFSFVLIKSADLVVASIRNLSGKGGSTAFMVSSLLLAIATSFPELFVGITSALEGRPEVSLGTVVGSNIANIGLVVGITGIIVGVVHVRGEYYRRDFPLAIFAGVLPLLLMRDGQLSRIDGAFLLFVYATYATRFFRKRFTAIAHEQKVEGFAYRFIRTINHVDSVKRKSLIQFVIGVTLMLFAADSMVKSAANLAELTGISAFTIGLVIVAAGTSLPEFAFSMRSLRRRESPMFLGNILGSTIVNSTLILGVVSVIAPITIFSYPTYILSAIIFLAMFLTFWYFIASKGRLERWEAALLLVLYFIFIITTLN